jgi:hypothetical protein
MKSFLIRKADPTKKRQLSRPGGDGSETSAQPEGVGFESKKNRRFGWAQQFPVSSGKVGSKDICEEKGVRLVKPPRVTSARYLSTWKDVSTLPAHPKEGEHAAEKKSASA